MFLRTALNDSDPLIRGAAAWALGKIGGAFASSQLAERLTSETVGEVRLEIEAALQESPELRETHNF